MKKLFLTLVIIFCFTSIAFAAHLTCDPQAGVTRYLFNILKIDGVDQQGSFQEQSAAKADGSAYHDISAWPVGNIEAEYFAGNEIILDGKPQGVYQWSNPAVPFVLIIPARPGPSTGSRLEP